jgi:hypothetical protein
MSWGRWKAWGGVAAMPRIATPLYHFSSRAKRRLRYLPKNLYVQHGEVFDRGSERILVAPDRRSAAGLFCAHGNQTECDIYRYYKGTPPAPELEDVSTAWHQHATCPIRSLGPGPCWVDVGQSGLWARKVGEVCATIGAERTCWEHLYEQVPKV